ncbi:hypothetical protein NUU61_002687 [Penicillium alfredii]|uniref:Uncharacterized protein n=1 Tax=Penicillium alfredii TaxID=1506179 RepID=A0A9W9FS28_9EURO|nr:uncharacterized protein NUU61_002687 [Penicillium alfredii]KAJ5105340.1 hypothetical protein NUU61_002687 [Penicillium alfredii]
MKLNLTTLLGIAFLTVGTVSAVGLLDNAPGCGSASVDQPKMCWMPCEADGEKVIPGTYWKPDTPWCYAVSNDEGVPISCQTPEQCKARLTTTGLSCVPWFMKGSQGHTPRGGCYPGNFHP